MKDIPVTKDLAKTLYSKAMKSLQETDMDGAQKYTLNAIDEENKKPLPDAEFLSILYNLRGEVYLKNGLNESALLDFYRSWQYDESNLTSFNNLQKLKSKLNFL